MTKTKDGENITSSRLVGWLVGFKACQPLGHLQTVFKQLYGFR